MALFSHVLAECLENADHLDSVPQSWSPLDSTATVAGLKGVTILVAHAPKNLSSATLHFHLFHRCA